MEALIKAQWEHAGCNQCKQMPEKLFMCPCGTAVYCGAACQTKHWNQQHALICGQDDEDNLPRMEKKVPKDVLNLLVPFMRGKDLKNFSESSQAAMSAYRQHVLTKMVIDLQEVPWETVMELAPWIQNIRTNDISLLEQWPTKHLIQGIELEGEAPPNFDDFHNLKRLVITNVKTPFVLPKTLTEVWLDGTQSSIIVTLGTLKKLTLRYVTEVIIIGSAPLDHLRIEHCRRGFHFENERPMVKKLYLEGTIYRYPLDGCEAVSTKGDTAYSYVRPNLEKSNVRVLNIEDVKLYTIALPARLESLTLVKTNDRTIPVLPKTLKRLNVRESYVTFQGEWPELTSVDFISAVVDTGKGFHLRSCTSIRLWRPSFELLEQFVKAMQMRQLTELTIHVEENPTKLVNVNISECRLARMIMLSGTQLVVETTDDWVAPEPLVSFTINNVYSTLGSIASFSKMTSNISITGSGIEASFVRFLQRLRPENEMVRIKIQGMDFLRDKGVIKSY
jgi:hypothetical protein